MIPSQTEVKYERIEKSLAAWWPLFEGPADFGEAISRTVFYRLVTVGCVCLTFVAVVGESWKQLLL